MYSIVRAPSTGAVGYMAVGGSASSAWDPVDTPRPPTARPPRQGVSFDRWVNANEGTLRAMTAAIRADLRELSHTHDGRDVRWDAGALEEALVRFAYRTSDVDRGDHARYR